MSWRALHPLLSYTEVAATLEQLADLGLLEDAATDDDWLSVDEQQRYDRQLEYFGELVAAATRGPPARPGCARRAWW